MSLRAVTLDAGGTLIAPAEPVGATYARFAYAHGVPCDATALERGFREAFAAAPPLAFPGVPAAERAAAERGWWRAVVAHAFGPGVTGPSLDALFAALFAHYAGGAAWQVLPGVSGTLATLRARGLRLAVVSNFDARLHRVLAECGLAAAVDRVLASTEVGWAKPAPEIFAHACDALGVNPADTLHVGDSLREDAVGARGAGLHAAWVGPAAPAADGVAHLPDITALPALVAAYP